MTLERRDDDVHRPIILDSQTLRLNDVAAQPEIRVEQARESIRKWLAIGFALTTAVAAAGYGLASIFVPEDRWQQASGPLGTIFTALVGLTGGIVGFYFSSRQQQ